MKTFKIVWTNYKLEEKYIIGILIQHDEGYIFKYNKSKINKAIEKGFIPFMEFPDIDKPYYLSKSLFQTFAIRLPKGKELSFNNGAELSTDRIKIYLRTGDNEK